MLGGGLDGEGTGNVRGLQSFSGIVAGSVWTRRCRDIWEDVNFSQAHRAAMVWCICKPSVKERRLLNGNRCHMPDKTESQSGKSSLPVESKCWQFRH